MKLNKVGKLRYVLGENGFLNGSILHKLFFKLKNLE